MFHFTQGLQHDLGVPAIAIGLGHADHGDQHVAIQGQVRAVARGDQDHQFVDFVGEIDAAGLEVAG
ncbi:hypothetical protein D3C80_1470780 [compost metagenome]